jgi:hypothetical protein
MIEKKYLNVTLGFIGLCLATLISCQKGSKHDENSYADWHAAEVTDLEKQSETKVTSILSCRFRPVENYHLYYSIYKPTKLEPKEEKVDKVTVKFYETAFLGNYNYSTNYDNAVVTSTKLSTKKVKVLIKKEELIDVIEVYEKETEVPNEKPSSTEKAKELVKTSDKSDKVVTADKVEEKLNAIEKFTKGYKLVLKMQRHSVTGESKNLLENIPFNSLILDKDTLKGITLECQ